MQRLTKTMALAAITLSLAFTAGSPALAEDTATSGCVSTQLEDGTTSTMCVDYVADPMAQTGTDTTDITPGTTAYCIHQNLTDENTSNGQPCNDSGMPVAWNDTPCGDPNCVTAVVMPAAGDATTNRSATVKVADRDGHAFRETLETAALITIGALGTAIFLRHREDKRRNFDQ